MPPVCALLLFHFDWKLVTLHRLYDKNLYKQTIFHLLSRFLEYVSQQSRECIDDLAKTNSVAYEQYEHIYSLDKDNKPCSLFMPGSALTFRPSYYSGVIVQDLFVLCRYLTPMFVGWKFGNTTGVVFHRVQLSTAGFGERMG
ncbi:hypothetical protein BGZ47_001315 [Haplosporangium gracile]|nr:hypothetical protein BGZ47_001315 [Haplosporangium gracile]